MSKAVFIFVSVTFLFWVGVSELFGQGYPDRAINVIIPMAAGDGLDVSGRLMAEELSNLLKVPIVPLNRPGASGTVGTDVVVKAKKDGYTILFTNSASIIYTKILYPENVPYQSFKDLTPLGLSTISPVLVVARDDAPYKNLRELVEYAKKNPGKVRCGTPGMGSVSDFNMEIIKAHTGAQITIVPFKGAMPAITALLGGHVEIIVTAIGPLITHLRNRKMKGIATSNAFSEFPDIPTFKQLGYPQDLLGVWFAYFAPAGISTPVTEVLVSAIEKVVQNPVVSSKLAQMGMIQEFETQEKLLTRMQEEYKIVEEIAKKSGMTTK
ncbi:MAG TPA: tripartite tricarboxylate transporter substrate binding protein [Thermodesulfobacteriota bacterium]|nr:tripartite tricarboxylate transporter substrate binding protein [Thermodesulfobacteriota bacterium]